jgi:hypothetical protein
MSAQVRGAFFLVASLIVFLIIIGVLALSTVMKPDRWSERPKLAS